MATVLAVAGCSSGQSPSNGARAAAAASSGSPGASLTVSSSIADGAHLDRALPWSAQVSPSAGVLSVDFIIDGKLAWTEHNPPYFFNDDHNLLPPWLLGAGGHTLTVRATSATGVTATAVSHVTVAAPPKVPSVLQATFGRMLTQADLQRVSNVSGYDPNNEPPTGLWTIHFGPNYLVALGDPTNPPGENETFQADAKGGLTLAGPANWLTPPSLRGGLCEPAPLDHYHWSLAGNVLTITGGTNCPNRKALFDGKWIRR